MNTFEYIKDRQFRQDETECFTVLNAFHRLLQDWKVQYAHKSPEAPVDDHYLIACQQADRIEYILDILTVGEMTDRVRLVDELSKTSKLAHLRKTMDDIKKEGTFHDEARAS